MIKYFSLYKIPTAPLVLGLGGTLPFILLPLIIWTGSNEIKLMALYNLINYSIIILSFIGAIHWGASMIREDISFKWYLISISPAILSFLLIMGFISNYFIIFILLMIIFLMMFFIDIKAVRNEVLPEWYLSLRKLLTIIVFLSLGSVCFAINNKVL